MQVKYILGLKIDRSDTLQGNLEQIFDNLWQFKCVQHGLRGARGPGLHAAARPAELPRQPCSMPLILAGVCNTGRGHALC